MVIFTILIKTVDKDEEVRGFQQVITAWPADGGKEQISFTVQLSLIVFCVFFLNNLIKFEDHPWL